MQFLQGVTILKAATLPEYVHMYVSIPSKLNVSKTISFVKSKTGKKPFFSKVVDHRIVARGNHTIATKRIMTMEEVDKQIAGWKKDERKY